MSTAADPSNAGSLIEAQVAEAQQGKAEMKAEADRRLASMQPAPSKDTPPKGETGRTPDGKFAAKDKAPSAPVTPEKAKDAPAAAKPTDRKWLSDFDEKARTFLQSAPEEVLTQVEKDLEKFGLRQKDYTQKTMSIAEKERALQAEEETLRFGRAVIRDPEMLAAVKQVDDRKRGVAPKQEQPEPFDHITATPEEFAAHEAQVRKLAADEAYARFQADRAAEEQVKAERLAMAVAAKTAFVDTGDYEPDTVNAVYDKLVEDGVQFTKENVVEKLRKWLPSPKTKEAPEATPPTAGSNGKVVSEASPLTRASGTAPLVTTPSFMQQGKAPQTVAERLQEAVFQANARRQATGQNLISFGSR